MTSSIARIFAIICAGAALVCVGMWLANGAPAAIDREADNPSFRYNGQYNILVGFGDDLSPAAGMRVLKHLDAEGYPAEISGDCCDVWIKKDYSNRVAADAVVLALGKEFSTLHTWVLPTHLYIDCVCTRPGRDGVSRFLVYDFEGHAVRGHPEWGTPEWPSHAWLFVLAASVVVSAVLSLLLLLRGTQTASIRYLGTGLGVWSLSICYLWLFSVVPTFDKYQPVPGAWGMVFDVVAFQMLLLSSYTFLRFWGVYPSAVTSAELDAFLAALASEQYAVVGKVKKKFFGFLQRDSSVEQAAAPMPRQVRPRLLAIPGPVKTGSIIILVLGVALLWRGWFEFAAHIGFLDSTAPLIVRSVFVWPLIGLVLIVYWPGLQCLRLFKYHSSVGSAEDRRKIEWIRAALWMGFVAFILPIMALWFMYLVRVFIPDFGLSFEARVNWGIFYLFLGLMSGPLIMMLALALSIFYRGTVDPRLALRGVTVWTLLGVLLTLIFVFVERSIAQKAVALLGLPPQTSLLTAGAIVAATFQPIRKQSEKYVNRFVERVLPTQLLASGSRHAAAVAVVDISGYAALSEQDEQSALLASALVQKEARLLADKSGGRVVKSTGDGAILAFGTAQQALDVVKELHATVSRGVAALNLPGLKLHSGLHWGEVVEMHDGDIYGQTVNVTARIADWAKAGEIGASQTFCEQVQQGSQAFESMGPQSFKNLQQPIICLRLSGA